MAFKLKLVEFTAWEDPQEICRDERCPVEGVHGIHARRPRRGEPISDAERRQRATIDECVYAHVATRYVRIFRDLYGDVIHDYGSITERGVYRAIERLIDERRIIRVVPWPNGRMSRLGGYLRYESPLLWSRDGHSSIQEQLQDLGYSNTPIVKKLLAVPPMMHESSLSL